MEASNVIWTIGHSTHAEADFMGMLSAYDVQLLADVRRFPNSARYPQFNQENLKLKLGALNIEYIHFVELGGRRNPKKDSPNVAWRVAAFRGYADYMETREFKEAVDRLQQLAMEKRTAFMCAEAPWWRCHRSLISDYLKAAGWKVIHIMTRNKSEEHPYTKPAVVVDGRLDYTGNSLKFDL
jgi:uncharacterized protein (DUF488 family)